MLFSCATSSAAKARSKNSPMTSSRNDARLAEVQWTTLASMTATTCASSAGPSWYLPDTQRQVFYVGQSGLPRHPFVIDGHSCAADPCSDH